MKHTPATPLPWEAYRVDDDSGNWHTSSVEQATNMSGLRVAKYIGGFQDAAYIAHAANAYPRLVELAKHAKRQDIAPDVMQKRALALLRELGEDQ